MEQAYFLPKPGEIVKGKPHLFFSVILLLITLLPGLAQPLAQVRLNAQPLLLSLANVQPDKSVSVIVQKSTKDTRLEQEVKGLGGTITGDLTFINSFGAELPAAQVPLLATKPGVKWISLDAPVDNSKSSTTTTPVGTPTSSTTTLCADCMDPKASASYTKAINANKVWNNSTNTAPWLQGQGIGVVVLDSGVDSTLADLADLKYKDGKAPQVKGTRVVNQIKTNKNAPSVTDLNGHGTMVAGVIASNGNGSNGAYAGVAPKANIISVKASNDNGVSTAMDVLQGIQWIYNNKDAYNIRVVNISFNSTIQQSYNLDPLDAGVESLWFDGITVVVSAGNNGTANLFAPANDPFVITVGAAKNYGTATASNWITAPFSAYGKDEAGGSKPDLVAPGTAIISGIGDASNTQLALKHADRVVASKYMKVAGTSFSAPQVAGAAALLLQSEPGLTPDQVKYRLKATALKNVAQGSWDTRTLWTGYNATTSGAGFLDVQAAVIQRGITGKANTRLVPSALFLAVLQLTGTSPVAGSSVNWSSVNWSSVNWSSVNWSSVNWSSVNWSSVNWSSVNWSSVNWSSVNWSSFTPSIYWEP